MDLVFLLDRSETIEDGSTQWDRTIDFVRDVLVPFDVTGAGHPGLADPSRNASRVAIATFADTQSVDVDWQRVDLDSESLAAQFGPREGSSLRTKALGGFTFVMEALRFLDSGSPVLANARDRTEMVHRVVVVLSDGNPTAGHAGGPAAALLRENHHTTIIAVGVGANANRAELAALVGQTGGHRRASMRPQEVFTGLDVASAEPLVDQLWQTICPTCNADVRDDCNRAVDCALATAYAACQATCCGLNTPGAPSSSLSEDEAVMGFETLALIIVAVLSCIVFAVLLVPFCRPSSGDAEITGQGGTTSVTPSGQVFTKLSSVYNNAIYWDDRNVPLYQMPAVAPPDSPHTTGARMVAASPYGTPPGTPTASPPPRAALHNPAYASTHGMA